VRNFSVEIEIQLSEKCVGIRPESDYCLVDPSTVYGALSGKAPVFLRRRAR
jgi:hypothetical protein